MTHQPDHLYSEMSPPPRRRFVEASSKHEASSKDKAAPVSVTSSAYEKKHIRPIRPAASVYPSPGHQRRFVESRGPLGRLKGTYDQLLDRYRQHADEETLQYAEHYQRLLSSHRFSEKADVLHGTGSDLRESAARSAPSHVYEGYERSFRDQDEFGELFSDDLI